MNRTGLFLLVAIIVVGGAAYWYMNRNKPAEVPADPAAMTDPAAAPADPAAATDSAAAPADAAAPPPADGAGAPPGDPTAPAAEPVPAPPPPGDPTQQ